MRPKDVKVTMQLYRRPTVSPWQVQTPRRHQSSFTAIRQGTTHPGVTTCEACLDGCRKGPQRLHCLLSHSPVLLSVQSQDVTGRFLDNAEASSQHT